MEIDSSIDLMYPVSIIHLIKYKQFLLIRLLCVYVIFLFVGSLLMRKTLFSFEKGGSLS